MRYQNQVTFFVIIAWITWLGLKQKLPNGYPFSISAPL